MTGVAIYLGIGAGTVTVLVWLKGWSDRDAERVQARAQAAWEARQCPHRLSDPRDIQLACWQTVAEAERITREAST